MDNHFGGVIWTNHAIDRLKEREIKQGDAWATFNRPERSRKGKSGNFVYYRNYNGTQIEVVAKKNEQGEWLILSVWSRLINPSNSKYYSFKNTKQTGRVSFWRWLYNLMFKV